MIMMIMMVVMMLINGSLKRINPRVLIPSSFV